MLIVVGVDYSDHAEEAAELALDYATKLGAELHVVHASQVPGYEFGLYASATVDVEGIRKARSDATWERIGQILDQAQVEVSRVEIEGYPPTVLANYAEQVEADLVVVGSRRYGEFRSWLLGSTSHGVVNSASCPVLIARRPD